MLSDDGTRIPLTSYNVVPERIEALRELFPEIFTEGAIDFAKLKQALGDFADNGPERYGLSWAGKSDAVRAVQSLSSGTLVPCKDESVNWDTTENLIIEGDNLEVLKLLQRSYYGKVKMIYIDPPYNTGNEFIYPDNYREGLEEYLRYTGQVDNGMRLSTQTETGGRIHSRWLDMMYPRLFLARNLLQDDGVIFVSIDDNEIHNLRLAMNEILGEENFIGQFVWKSRQNKDNRNVTGASIDHEYVLCYGRRIRGGLRVNGQYSNPDNDPRGNWTSGNMVGLASEDRRPNLHYDLVDPSTGINYGRPRLGWRYDPKTMARLIAEDKILWPGDPQGRPRRKLFLSELTDEFTGFSSVVAQGVFTRDGTADVDALFGERVMDFPKPTALIKALIEQGSPDEGIILDFFAGSGTTAQAVLELNEEHSENRKFILVQLPEPTGNKDFPTIAELCKERVRRVINKLNEEENGELDLKDSPQDRGFKVLKLTSSNFKLWNADTAPKDAEGLAEQLKLYADHVLPDRSQDDILYELLLKAGLSLTSHIETKTAAGQKFYSVNGGALLACLEDPIKPETLRDMMNLKPERVLCLDHAFSGNDQLKTNIVLEMKSHEIRFQTV